jgi:hypothetical protein
LKLSFLGSVQYAGFQGAFAMSYTTKFHFLDPLHATGNKIDGYLQILCRTAAPLAALPAEQLSEPINAQIDSVARRKPEAAGISPESNENACGVHRAMLG